MTRDRKEDLILTRMMRALSTFSGIHNNEVAPLLTKHDKGIDQLKEDVQVLFELVEMNNSVLIRALSKGVDTGTPEFPKEVIKLQDEYLAIQAIFGFFLAIKG